MDTKPLKEMTFSNKLKKISFNVKYEFSFIKIKKLILKSHLNLDNLYWVPILSDTNLIIRSIKTEKTKDGKEIQTEKIENKFNLMQFLSPNHKFPMLDVSIELPTKNDRDYFNSFNFHNIIEVEVEVLSKKMSDYEYLVYYEDTPGILNTN